jgi:L-fuconolactonase
MSREEQYEIIDSHVILHAGTGPVAETRRKAGLPSDLIVPGLELEDSAREIVAAEMAVLAMAAAGVDGGLWYGERSSCKAALSVDSDRFRAMVHFPDPDVPDAEQALSEVKETPGMAGVRLTPSWPQSGEYMQRLRDGGYDTWFSQAERLGVPVALYMFGPDLKYVANVAESYPELKLIIDHLGMDPVPLVPLTQGRLDPLPDLVALAKYENVVVKCSGLPALSFESYPFADIWPVIQALLEAFGPSRLMWGSDFRRLRTLYPYAEIVGFVKYSSQLSPDEKRLLLGDSLKQWIGWSARS